MYRRILVPVDGSAAAATGLRHALKLAKDQKARVRVLHVLDIGIAIPAPEPYAIGDMTPVIEAMRSEGKRILQRAAMLAKRSSVSAENVQLESGANRVSDVILREAKKWRADLVVMGTHGRRGLNRLVLGSDAERVVRETRTPLLLVRARRDTR